MVSYVKIWNVRWLQHYIWEWKQSACVNRIKNKSIWVVHEGYDPNICMYTVPSLVTYEFHAFSKPRKALMYQCRTGKEMLFKGNFKAKNDDYNFLKSISCELVITWAVCSIHECIVLKCLVWKEFLAYINWMELF